ncbi:unnamed protein product [Cylindrotheca closterium]|uniref:PDZ domain-containing protein n=1 Tax=Cylindrotheca closterium TaxID=2856 RepID=A0AAD2FXJ9_9STRA|nr:unnamed protein product [Cylindrotheca closterium]
MASSEEESPIIDISKYYDSICYANILKESKNEKLGLVVKRSSAWDTLYISRIKDTSKFADSKLEVGMVILTINRTKCPKTVKAFQKLMKETTEGDLTIMAATISKEIDITKRPRGSSAGIMSGEAIKLLPLSGIISCYVAIVALILVGFNHGTFQYQGPAQSSSDYRPVLFVAGAVLSLLYAYYWLQSYTTFSEYFRLKKEAKLETNLNRSPPSLPELKYGKTDNPAIRCADRCAGNLHEQLIPFFMSMFAYATFVDAGGAARIGWAWFVFRSYYSYAFKRFPLLFASTLPAYCCVWYMMGMAIYSAATSA